ncbi:MAG: type II secretion system F family protein, partial [Bacillota bacterium]
MPFYSYQVVDSTGQVHTGKLEADGETAAVDRLRKLGYTALEVKEVRESPLKNVFKIRKSVGIGDLSLFSRQLASMLNAGIPLIRTLHALADQAPNPTLRSALSEIATSVEGGVSFSESLRVYPDIFSAMYVDMVRAGEIGGNLVDVLGRLSDQLDKDKRLRDNIKSATFYPLVVIAFAIIILIAMLLFIVPVFTAMFPSEAALPLPTRII